MRIAERLLVWLGVGVASVLPAQAQYDQDVNLRAQSLPLSEIVKVGRDTPDLLRQIDVELRRNYLKEGDVTCMASPLGGRLRSMNGGRGAPYQCQFGDRTLRIVADRTFFDVGGKRLGRPGEEPDPTQLNRARSFRENNLRWGWSPEMAR
jgi:hypothetical protein